MDPARFAPARYLESKISALLARIPARHRRSAFDPETLSLLRGIGWWMASCILAWISLESTREMTLIEFRNSHSPPRTAWESVLIAHGYHMSSDTAPHLPKGVFRVSTDQNRVLLPSELSRLDAPSPSGRIWQRGGGGASEWKDRPFSLEGFEAWILELDTHPNPPKTSPSRNGRITHLAGNSIDPREIRY